MVKHKSVHHLLFTVYRVLTVYSYPFKLGCGKRITENARETEKGKR